MDMGRLAGCGRARRVRPFLSRYGSNGRTCKRRPGSQSPFCINAGEYFQPHPASSGKPLSSPVSRRLGSKAAIVRLDANRHSCRRSSVPLCRNYRDMAVAGIRGQGCLDQKSNNHGIRQSRRWGLLNFALGLRWGFRCRRWRCEWFRLRGACRLCVSGWRRFSDRCRLWPWYRCSSGRLLKWRHGRCLEVLLACCFHSLGPGLGSLRTLLGL